MKFTVHRTKQRDKKLKQQDCQTTRKHNTDTLFVSVASSLIR